MTNNTLYAWRYTKLQNKWNTILHEDKSHVCKEKIERCQLFYKYIYLLQICPTWNDVLYYVCQLRIEWRPVCVHAIWTRLVMRQIMVNSQASTIALLSHGRKQIVNNTYIYIFPHNLCKIQVFKLKQLNYCINFNNGSVNRVFGTAISRFTAVMFKTSSNINLVLSRLRPLKGHESSYCSCKTNRIYLCKEINGRM